MCQDNKTAAPIERNTLTQHADSVFENIKRRVRDIERERLAPRAQNEAAFEAAYSQGQAEGQAATASMDAAAKNAASPAALGYYVPPSLAEMCAKRIAHVQHETHERIVRVQNEKRDFERLQELSALLERNPETARILDLIGALNLR